MRPDTVPLRQILSGRRGGFFVAILLAEFGAAMQGIAYSTVLPVVAADLDGRDLFGATLAAGPIAAVLMLSVTAPLLARVRPGAILLAATLLYVAGAALAVFAPAMGWVLAGTVVRGVAAGLLGGFGLGALGALYDDRERPRVMGLFAFVWLLPSVLGPALNAAITAGAGWRWALAWPALLVVAARLLMGGFVRVVPWERRQERLRPLGGVLVAVFLGVGAWGSAGSGVGGTIVFAIGVLGAIVATVAFLRTGSAPRVLVAFGWLCAAFFGLYELLSLAVIEGLGGSLGWAAAAVTGGLLAWSLAGLRPRPDARPDRATLGTLAMPLSAVLVVVALALPGQTVSLVLVVVAAAAGGLGMGLAYPLLSTEPFRASGAASTTGTLIAFAEVAPTAWAVLAAGGIYSTFHDAGARPALIASFALVGVMGVAAVLTTARRR